MPTSMIGRLAAGAAAGLAALAVASAALAADPRCSQEPNLRSQNDATPVQLHFVNRNADPQDRVSIYWLDYQGRRVLYKHLDGGALFVVDTYLTHPWLVATANWEAYMICQEIIMPEAPIRFAVVGGYPEE